MFHKSISRFSAMSFVFFAGLLVTGAFAQDPSRPQLNNLSQTGQLMTVKLVPKDKNLDIFLAGKPAAKIDLRNAEVEVTILDDANSPRNLKLIKRAGYYSVDELMNYSQPVDLQVKATVKDRSETFKFRVDNKPR